MLTAAGRAASSEASVCCTVASADLVRGSGWGQGLGQGWGQVRLRLRLRLGVRLGFRLRFLS